MRRSWFAFGLAIAGGIFVSTALVIGMFLLDNAQQIGRLDPEFTSVFAEALETDALLDPERSRELRQLTINYVSSNDNAFNEIVRVLRRALEPRTRLLLTSLLVALPMGLITALLIGNYVSRPVQAVSRAARRVAAGDLGARAAVGGLPAQRGMGAELVHDFNKMAESLETLEYDRKKMITDVAHELRTPLTIVQGQLDAMQYGVVPTDRTELAKLSRHTELLARLIRDLRVLSQADSRSLTLDRTDIDMQTLVADVVDGFQDQAHAEELDLVFARADAEPLWLHGDGDRLAQVLINLLSNALRHARSSVAVTLDRSGTGGVLLTVRDDGDGFTAEEAARVFDRFYRTDASRNRASGGSGLGLAIARAIAELHGGSLSVRTPAGGGTEFRLLLDGGGAAPDSGRQP
ncbi:MAG TPA: ATP-binding protein [Deinococcales bacterium]|nr:ATP-binding protein [Deinococcales bacterium]